MLEAQCTVPIRDQGLPHWLYWALGWCLCGETESGRSRVLENHGCLLPDSILLSEGRRQEHVKLGELGDIELRIVGLELLLKLIGIE